MDKVCVYKCMYVCTPVRVYKSVFVSMPLCVYKCISVCVCAYLCVGVRVCVCVRACMCSMYVQVCESECRITWKSKDCPALLPCLRKVVGDCRPSDPEFSVTPFACRSKQLVLLCLQLLWTQDPYEFLMAGE